MKMKLGVFLLLLTISLLSYGFVGTVNALDPSEDCISQGKVWQNNACVDATKPPKNDLNLQTDLDLYAQGGVVVITGLIHNIENLSTGDVGIIVKTPDGNIVAVDQIHPNADGSFQAKPVKADGPLFKSPGVYTVFASFSGLKSQITFEFTGGNGAIVSGGDSQPTTCPSGQNLINGKCVAKPTPEPEPTPEPVPTEPTPEPEPVQTEPEPTCGTGTELVNGICQVVKTEVKGKGGACLIATAAYGTELAPQVQFLREIRDNTVMSTTSGMAFMTGFNQLYYSFSPTIADLEREHPMFQEAVRAFITPMISTLSIMTLAEDGSDAEVLGLGISVITLNLGMYIAAPTVIGFKVHKYLKSRK